VVGSPVRVRGQTQGSEIVLAERIELLSSGKSLPDVEDDETEVEEEDNEGPNQQNENNSGPGSGGESSVVHSASSEPESDARKESFEGTVNSMGADVWVVDGMPVDVSSAEIKGTPTVGAAVKVEGYTNASGVFVVTRIEFEKSSAEDENGSGSGGSQDVDNSADNSNGSSNENEAEHEEGNGNSNDNGNENGED
jgi:hypothetical protein